MGLLLSGFFWTYAVMQMPFGYFADEVGARIALLAAVVWWSIFTALTAAARALPLSWGADFCSAWAKPAPLQMPMWRSSSSPLPMRALRLRLLRSGRSPEPSHRRLATWPPLGGSRTLHTTSRGSSRPHICLSSATSNRCPRGTKEAWLRAPLRPSSPTSIKPGEEENERVPCHFPQLPRRCRDRARNTGAGHTDC